MRKLILATASALALGIVGAGPLYAQNTYGGTAGTAPGAQKPATEATQPAMPNAEATTLAMPSPSASNPSSEAAAAPASKPIGDWSKLSRADMRQIQEKLRADGFYHGRIDGLDGRGTQLALRTYQRRNGLSVTGTPDPQTLSRLQMTTAGVGASTAPGSSQMSPSSGAGASGMK